MCPTMVSKSSPSEISNVWIKIKKKILKQMTTKANKYLQEVVLKQRVEADNEDQALLWQSNQLLLLPEITWRY